MLSRRRLWSALTAAVFGLSACGCARLSEEEALVVGQWQINTQNGAVWRYTFSRDYRVTISLPRDETVDANQRDAKFDVVAAGTWHIDGNDVVYIEPERTSRIPLSELRAARPFPSNEARWERM